MKNCSPGNLHSAHLRMPEARHFLEVLRLHEEELEIRNGNKLELLDGMRWQLFDSNYNYPNTKQIKAYTEKRFDSYEDILSLQEQESELIDKFALHVNR